MGGIEMENIREIYIMYVSINNPLYDGKNTTTQNVSIFSKRIPKTVVELFHLDDYSYPYDEIRDYDLKKMISYLKKSIKLERYGSHKKECDFIKNIIIPILCGFSNDEFLNKYNINLTCNFESDIIFIKKNLHTVK